MRRISILLLLAGALASMPAARAAGYPDPTFGKGGVVTAFPAGSIATAVGIDAANRITVVGYTISSHPDVAVVRLRRDGTLDPSFSGDGRARFDLGAVDRAFDAVVTARGGVAIVGRRSGREERIFVLRITPDGSRMRSFGTNGLAVIDAGTRDQSADAIAFTPHGRIVVGGYRSQGTHTRSLLARLTPDGSLDPAFGGDGIAAFDLSEAAEQVNDLIVLPSGAVVATGTVESGQEPRYSILKTTSDGRLARPFGRRSGWSTFDAGKGPDEATSLVQAADGDFLLAGSTHGDWVVLGVKPTGILDASYGDDGRALIPGPPAFEQAAGIVRDGHGAYVVGRMRGGSDDVGVVRFLATGVPDPAFSDDGVWRLDIAGNRDTAAAAALQPNGRLVIVGQTWPHVTPRFLAVRLHGLP